MQGEHDPADTPEPPGRRKARRARPRRARVPSELRLTGRAARFLQLLQDFGHLDEEGVARLLLGVGASHGTPVRLLDLDELRRAAAITLFNQSDDGEVDGLLAEDWPLLFS